METVDRKRMSLSIYESLKSATNSANWTNQDTQNVIAASSEGYSFPTNLDLDPPLGEHAPET